jgi:perosamine synthetase
MGERIPLTEPEIGNDELENVTKAVKSGWVSSKGQFIEEFEKGFCAYIGAKHGVTTCNGTTALHLALSALGIGKGDTVLVPSLTFIASANAVTYTGAKPVLIDSHPEYWCIDPSKIEKAIDHRTKAVLIVHLYGHPCNMDELTKIAEDKGLIIVEDCAEALGAEYKGKKVGTSGTVSCFSFYGNKIITTGEGGMCLTDDDELAEKMKMLRDHGMNPQKKYWHDVVGFNYRMTNLQAALGVAQLKKIGFLIQKKREIANTYKRFLKKLDVTTAPEMPWAKSVYWLYSILVERSLRDKIIKHLQDRNIETRPFFHPLHTLPPYKTGTSLPIAEDLAARGINLPTGTKLKVEEMERVTDVLESALRLS